MPRETPQPNDPSRIKIRKRSLLENLEGLRKTVDASKNTANDLLKHFGSQIELQDLTIDGIVDFANFLENHLLEVLEVSNAVRLTSSARSVRERNETIEKITLILGGGKPGFFDFKGKAVAQHLSGAAILARNSHWNTHYRPVIEALNKF